jgi:hypothetical protein
MTFVHGVLNNVGIAREFRKERSLIHAIEKTLYWQIVNDTAAVAAQSVEGCIGRKISLGREKRWN